MSAIDIDEVSLEKARRTVKGVDFRIGSGEFLEFPDDYFDNEEIFFNHYISSYGGGIKDERSHYNLTVKTIAIYRM